MKYTELELKVIKAFGKFMNYDTLEDNLADNATCVTAGDIAEITGLDIKTVKGVLGSLEKKDLVFVDIINFNHKVLMVSDEGVTAYYELFGNNPEETEEETIMMKVIERATGTEMQAKRIDGGYEVFTMDGEKYKKLKESTFKKYFKLTGETVSKDKAAGKAEKSETKKATKKQAAEQHEELAPDKREKMIAKIKKMLALAENNPSMEEGLAAALQAQKLMAKYNIHKDDVELEEIKDEIKSVFSKQKHNSHLLAWRKQLALIVAENFRCKCYMSGQDIVFRGYVEDAKLALDVYMMLYTVGNKLGSKAYADQKAETGSGKGAFNSFVTGFVKGVHDAFSEQCTALLVITPKEVEEEWETFSANFKQGRAGSLTITDASLYKKGYQEGKSVAKSRSIGKKEKK